MSDLVKCRRDSGIAVLEIAGMVGGRSALTNLTHEMKSICSGLIQDRDLRVIILEGSADDAFSMGDSLLRDIQAADGKAETGPLPSPAAEIAALDRPVIAAVRGDAIGPGLELVLACDLRVSSDSSTFALPHMKYGLVPWDGGTQRLSRLIGLGRAAEMVLTGEGIDAVEACRLGLINHSLPPEGLRDHVWDLARKLAERAPFSVGYTKEAINRGMDLSLQQGLSLEADLYFLLHTTRDRQEGVKAFQEKRPPRFMGE